MLQALLEERFQLTIRHELRDLPVYVLLVGTDGSKLKAGEKPDSPSDMRMSGGKGLMIGQGLPMAIVIESLSEILGRPVTDATALKGYYDFRLEWTLEESDAATPNNGGPPVFTAVREQLGLKLEARKGPVDVLVIESAVPPSGN